MVEDDINTHHESLWTPTRSPLTGHRQDLTSRNQTTLGKPGHTRSQSFSTIDEHHLSGRDSDVGAFRVVIDRPGTGPKMLESFNGIPALSVPIPSYKLGTPRFSTKGTAFLRGSSYTNSEDMRSSAISHDQMSRDSRHTRILSRRHSDASRQTPLPTSPSSPADGASPSSLKVVRQRAAIIPEMFDALTFKPACDSPSVVRYTSTGAIRAASPARLVAEITSPTFCDYDLLSDFFLTFRSFLDTTDLLYMMIARLKWALSRNDETGTVVRVRTFVAIRHWILNYFADDFVIDYELRKSFCDLLNTFGVPISEDPARAKVQLKILGELKKCWRRVCALYWDSPEFGNELGPEVPIVPGGVAGSRNPNLDPSFWKTRPDGPPRLDGIVRPDFVDIETAQDSQRFFADVSRAGHMHSMVLSSNIPRVQVQNALDEPPLSPSSIVSEDFVSCSFPHRQRGVGGLQPQGAHPVPASSTYGSAPIAITPKALTGKRVRPNQIHKRSASFSDSYRDRRLPTQPVHKVLFKSTEILLAVPYAGSLVRGNLFPPGHAFVDVAPSTPAGSYRQTTLFSGSLLNPKPSAMSGPGMKKLLGSVRRALGNRTGISPNASPTQGSFPHIAPLGIRGVTINRLPGTAIVPQSRPRDSPMRIDLLGAEVAEHFKKAVQEDAEAEMEKRQAQIKSTQNNEYNASLHYSSPHPDANLDLPQPRFRREPISQVTNGSQSIVIVDDTFELDLPVMTGALPHNPSVDTFADAFMQPSGGPTPPSTPPEGPRGTPRRSSHLLGEHTRNQSHFYDETPSLVIDSHYTAEDEPSPSHPVQGRIPARMHSFKSKRSTSLRRYASYQSGFTRHKSERSFDATTFSGTEEIERLSQLPAIPLPLRPLRRRPGGDLRAVSNVEDLNTPPLRRPMSTGSLTTYSESVRSSFLFGQESNDYAEASSEYVDVLPSDYDQSRTQSDPKTFSLGALAEPAPRNVSLFSTHSSQPGMRPSFEKEAQMLAQIPDDEDDDGGVESALLKLEGKFEKRHSDISGQSQSQEAHDYRNSIVVTTYEVNSSQSVIDEEEEKLRHRHKQIVENPGLKTPPMIATYQPSQHQVLEELQPAVYQPRGMQYQHTSALISPRSIESYSSIPLLERGLVEDSTERNGRRKSRNWSAESFLHGPSKEDIGFQTPESSHRNSYDFMNETESLRRMPPRHRTQPSGDHSFLLDSDTGDDRSDLSSELSLEIISKTEYTEHDTTASQDFPPVRAGTVIKEMALPSHPLRHPPSPHITMTQALNLSPAASYPTRFQSRQEQAQYPPTPEVTPTTAVAKASFGVENQPPPMIDPLRSHRIQEPSRKTSVHLPFILAFDSQVLAQQFTLIEKDALNEIDWKDLIEMRWKDASTEARSWVEFLRVSEPRGVEVVIARFNLVVKWAVSECVLTQNLEERVRCIIKYIHIAAQCRKYRNFATMTQITVALTSKDVSRLTKTWALVPAADVDTLRDLENLVTPSHNFYNLRAEMEGAGAGLGCIPFVGIYTHDLLINSDRPSQIASTPTTEPLINFEKCRTDATIVKNLLRLLEASSLYRFLPIEGVTERCLWMAALTDDDIKKHGDLIQAE